MISQIKQPTKGCMDNLALQCGHFDALRATSLLHTLQVPIFLLLLLIKKYKTGINIALLLTSLKHRLTV